jgi:hypothetical protein
MAAYVEQGPLTMAKRRHALIGNSHLFDLSQLAKFDQGHSSIVTRHPDQQPMWLREN